MKNFIKFTFATIVGLFIFSFLGIFMLIGIIGSSSKKEPFKVKENSVLKLKLNSEIVDRASENPLKNFDFQSFDTKTKIGLNNIIKELEFAKTDDKIKGIFLDLTYTPAGMATLEEIRNSLKDFKESGKFIIAYGDYFTQKTYYLASIADKIYMNPEGLVEFKGLNAQIMFFTDALKKIGVEPVVIRHGKFKSAVEPFILKKMSDANKEQTIKFIGTIWENILNGIAESRGLTTKKLNIYADSMYIRNAESAVNYKLIDALKYKDEVLTDLQDSVGVDDYDDINFVSLKKYKDAVKLNKKPAKDKIAIIYASGLIDMGKGDAEKIGSETLSKQIRIARKDTTIKAIILRVNSPGGSALASEVIWREMILAKKAKPIVVSMGDVAASGGYYISCPANKILANKNTITGSIGVFGLLWNTNELINNIGINVDGVKTNEHSDIGSPFRKITADEKAVIQQEVENVYHTFISHVGEGRNMTTAQVDSIGQGRVWSGVNAIEIGLVDEFGGLKDAVKEAAKLAKLKTYKIKELPKKKNFMEEILNKIKGDMRTSVLKENLGYSYKYYNGLNKILRTNGIQAVMPFEFDIY